MTNLQWSEVWKYFIHFILYFFKINALTILRVTLILKSHIYYIFTRSLSSCLLSTYPKIELFMRNLNANKDTKPSGPFYCFYIWHLLFSKYSCRIALSRNLKMCYDKTFFPKPLYCWWGIFLVCILNNNLFPKRDGGKLSKHLFCFFSLC